jgi:hypothetical protein
MPTCTSFEQLDNPGACKDGCDFHFSKTLYQRTQDGDACTVAVSTQGSTHNSDSTLFVKTDILAAAPTTTKEGSCETDKATYCASYGKSGVDTVTDVIGMVLGISGFCLVVFLFFYCTAPNPNPTPGNERVCAPRGCGASGKCREETTKETTEEWHLKMSGGCRTAPAPGSAAARCKETTEETTEERKERGNRNAKHTAHVAERRQMQMMAAAQETAAAMEIENAAAATALAAGDTPASLPPPAHFEMVPLAASSALA